MATREEQENERKKRKAFRSETPQVGALATFLNPQASNPNSAPEPPMSSTPQAPTSVGQLATPSTFGREPPASSADELNARTARNESFLKSPEVQQSLLQFGIAMMATAGGGNIGSNIGQALGLAVAAPGRAKDAEEARAARAQTADIEERKMTLQERELALKEGALGNRKYTRIVSSDSPVGLDLGIPKGQAARVTFEEDAQGNIVNYAVEANPFETGIGGSKVTQLLDEAEREQAAGRPERAALLRQQAEREATGMEFTGSLEGGQEISYDAEGNRIIRNIPGGKAAEEATAAEDKRKDKQFQEIQASINVNRSVNDALETITSAKYPNISLTGFGSYLEYIRGTGAHDLAATLDTIKANLGFAKLQDIRDASQTGGALGPVSDFENRLLQSTVTNLMNSQSSGQLVDNLRYLQVLFQDAQYTGLLTQIGNQVDAEEMDLAAGIVAAGEYVDRVVAGEKIDSIEFLESIGDPERAKAGSPGATMPPAPKRDPNIPEVPPAYLEEVDRLNWPEYSDEEKKAIMQVYGKGK